MHVQTLKCFGARPGEGNPALVIEDDGMDPAARQAFAAERNTTCVFLSADGEVDYLVDYFYPHMRSPLCLHATLAVAAVLFGRPGAAETMSVRTAMKGQRLTLSREGGDYFVQLAPQPAPEVTVDEERIAALLNAPGLVLASKPQVASVGSPKLLVEVRDADALYGLAPDLAGIAAWGKQHGVSGLYVWCRLDEATVEGRNFNHLDPSLEDGATGVAAGALAVALHQALTVRQGRAAGHDCLIKARAEGGAILVGGTVEA
jgi:PhzF family phenazine biosynthesis protein